MYKFEIDVDMAKFLEEAKECLHSHWQELANYQDVIPLHPDVDKYVALQNNGILRNIVVYKEGKVVGYSIVFVQPNLHYSKDVFGYVDVIYVHPSCRASTAGARLLLVTEQIAKNMKVSVLSYHTKPNVPDINRSLVKLGYTRMEEIYSKLLKE